jgi:hypothetical protein
MILFINWKLFIDVMLYFWFRLFPIHLIVWNYNIMSSILICLHWTEYNVFKISSNKYEKRTKYFFIIREFVEFQFASLMENFSNRRAYNNNFIYVILFRDIEKIAINQSVLMCYSKYKRLLSTIVSNFVFLNSFFKICRFF